MEFNFDVLWIVIVIIGWVISAANKANKKQQEQAKKNAQQNRQSPPARVNRAQPVQTTPRNSGRTASTAKPAGASAQVRPAAPTQPKPLQTIRPTETSAFVSSHSEPLETHMHVPEMGVEGEGTEGVDCCHEYMLDDHAEAELLDVLSLGEEDQRERAQALLQGVIFSEILGRHRVKGYGRRSA